MPQFALLLTQNNSKFLLILFWRISKLLIFRRIIGKICRWQFDNFTAICRTTHLFSTVRFSSYLKLEQTKESKVFCRRQSIKDGLEKFCNHCMLCCASSRSDFNRVSWEKWSENLHIEQNWRNSRWKRETSSLPESLPSCHSSSWRSDSWRGKQSTL